MDLLVTVRPPAGATALPRPLTSLRLRQTLMLDLYSDQMNIVNIEAGSQKQSALFRAGNEEQEIFFTKK